MHQSYVLHTRPYRDTSLLVELWSEEHGRMTAVAKGARRSRTGWRSLLQPFQLLWVDWFGKHDLVTLKNVEAADSLVYLTGNASVCGFYLNELLMRLTHRHDPHPALFATYKNTLEKLDGQTLDVPLHLRIFEKRLLEELGYGIKLDQTLTGEVIDVKHNYIFEVQGGFRMANLESCINQFSGAFLLSFHNEQLDSKEHLNEAKRLMRLALAPHLGDKPLVSRELFF